MLRTRWVAGVLASVLLTISTAALAEEPARKWGAFLDIEGKVGTKRNLGEATLFVPLWQDEATMLFGDVRFKMDDQNGHEGNFGLGVRRMMADGWNAGLYGFFDRRHSPNDNMFNQLTFGAEVLGTNFDFRANTYWPVGNTVQAVGQPTQGPTTAAVSGGTLQVTTPAMLQRFEYALRGFDAEAGVRVPILPSESPYQLRFYAGGFRFDEPTGVAAVVAGPRLRLEFTDYDVPGLWNGTRFTVGAEWQTDEVRGSPFFAGLRLRVPLQAEPNRATRTLQERRMTDTIVRDVDIVANAQTVQVAPAVSEQAFTATGETITGISSATTTGAALPGAVAAAGSNSFVVLQGTFGTGTTTVVMQGGQTLMGGGSVSLRTASGRLVTATLPGATISGTGTGPAGVVQVTDNTTLSGMTIIGASSSGAGVFGVRMNDTSTGATITNNTITVMQTGANGAVGLLLGSNNTATVSGNTVTVTGPTGQTMTALGANNGGTYTISGNTLSASGGTTNRAISLAGDTLMNSTGNVKAAGICNNGGGNTGSVGFTDGTTCP
ncbi:MAG: inverse autotransporter beta domain-containing protein [Alphaproteobacteria bacterium]|nr:inverse autotransporter beta domain-containing protein [Alphaproteobacteria bacterium]